MKYIIKKIKKILNDAYEKIPYLNKSKLDNESDLSNSSESDSDSEFNSESELDNNSNYKDYILYNYEKDLEIAIKKSLAKISICNICFKKNINSIFIPCGHLCCCLKCAKKCKTICPICRKKVKINKVYFI